MQGLLITGCGFVLIAVTTFFLSSRKRLFIRLFVLPQENARNAIRGLAKGQNFQTGMRSIGVLQAIAGVIMIIVWMVHRFS